jgi:hypothetical protein
VIAVVLATGCVPKPRSYQSEQLQGPLRVAILPLANYTETRDASEKVAPILFALVGQLPSVSLVDPGAVEATLSTEPWLLFDRIPPDLVDRFGDALGADALLVGSIVGYGYRQSGGEQVPHFSISLRLMQAPGGRALWSVAHSRDGNDGEWLFGLGRVQSLQQLVAHSIREITETFPPSPATAHIPGERSDEGGL